MSEKLGRLFEFASLKEGDGSRPVPETVASEFRVIDADGAHPGLGNHADGLCRESGTTAVIGGANKERVGRLPAGTEREVATDGGLDPAGNADKLGLVAPVFPENI